MERRLLVRSDPPGAEVFLDGELRGETGEEALAIPFDHYGTRTLILRRAGCVPVREEVVLDPPWYQVFPLGLAADLLWPGTIADEHLVEVALRVRGEPRDPRELAQEAEHFATHEERRP